MSISNLCYVYYFLKNYLPNIFKRVILFLIGFRFLFFLIALLFFPILRDWFFIDIIIFGVSFILGLVSLIKGYPPAGTYLIGFSFLLIGFVIHALKIFEPNSIITVYSPNAGLLLEVVFIAIAISNQYRFQVKQKEKATDAWIEENKLKEKFRENLIEQLKEKEIIQNRVNQELEEKVNQKTIELINKNQEIERINRLLDEQNYYLQKDIKSIKAEIVTGKAINNVEFYTVFDTEFKCLKYLENLKWKDDANIKCKFCGSDKIIRDYKKFNLRCRNCNKVESLTSGTIFHAHKIPLEKAFYILYIEVNNIKISNPELSDKLGILPKTIWSTRKKIREAINNLTTKNYKPTFDEVILGEVI